MAYVIKPARDKVERIRRDLSKFEYVQFSISDINGTSRGKVIPVRNADHFEKGTILYCGTLMLGYKNKLVFPQEVTDTGYANMAIIPDLDTLHAVPWAGNGKYKIAEFYCETAWMPNLEYQIACPRYMAKQQCQKLGDLGYDLFSGFEIEFVLKHQKTGKLIFDGCDYYMNKTFRLIEGFVLELDNKMLESGVDIIDFHLEYRPGMVECVLKPQWGINSPDMTFGLVQGILEMSPQHDLIPTFTSKPTVDETGIGTHFNHSLWNKETKTNAFYDQTKADGLSDIARYWIGGLIKHSGALTAICSPTVNCYRRLFQSRAPGKCFWDIDNRHATIRMKNDGSEGTYCENRIPSGKSNPYLVFAATVAAGIDGIVNKIKCPPTKDPSAPDLPVSLSSALDELKNDDVMVSALSQQFVDWFVQLKTESEIKPLLGEDSPKDDQQRFLLETEMYK